jgi:predicted amino acid racemase
MSRAFSRRRGIPDFCGSSPSVTWARGCSRYNRESGNHCRNPEPRGNPPTWAEVSLTTLRQNFRTVQKHVGAKVTVCAVVKADAYGHGAVECSRALEAEGAKWLGVTSLDEAIPLREAGFAPTFF